LLAIRSLIESINIFKTGEFFDAEETGAWVQKLSVQLA
jgi:hypothetical protein